MTETIGERLFKIRAACGKGERDPETLDDFAVRVAKATGVSYNPVTLSLLERGKRHWRVADVEAFARVDPLNRGKEWLAFGDEAEQPRAAEPDHRRPVILSPGETDGVPDQIPTASPVARRRRG